MNYATVTEMVRAWDGGHTVWTLEMGGLGPGYEQAIQTLVIELLRDHGDKPLPADGDIHAWREWGDDTVSRIDQTCGGFSGAQVGAAKQLAAAFIKHGPDGFWGFLEKEAPERTKDRIQVSKFWPKAS